MKKGECYICGHYHGMYVVNDDLWRKYGVGNHHMCIRCFESRLGRCLHLGDLKAVPVNDVLVHFYALGCRTGNL